MTTSIAVAVCTRPGAPLLSDCLEALARAGVAGPVIATAKRQHGLAVARNEALARCRAAEIIAYVDDDVFVAPGWLRALETAWAAAPRGVAAIGGPIAAGFRASRPAWLGDELLAALGATAPAGSGAFDANQRTLPAGNLSFRTAALRGVGGFWPARGRANAHDWFTEEHEAQRELGRAGWELREDDALTARRIVDTDGLRRTGVAMRRARYGARSALLGTPRPRGVAARTAAWSAAGATLAAVTGDAGRATARAVRAAENAGVLLGPVAAHAEVQPVAGRTPFRHTIAAAQPGPLHARFARLPRHRRSVRPLIIGLHRITPPVTESRRLTIAPDRFVGLLDRLRAERTPAPLDAIVAGEAPADAVAVTLDDGYVDNLTVALPLLETAGVPATVFVSTGHVEAGRAFWWDELNRLLRLARPGDAEPLGVELGGDRRAWPARTPEERAVAAAHLLEWLPPHLPEAIDVALDGVAAWGRVPRGVEDTDRPLTVEELRRLAASPLITIGSHARTHPSLAFVAPERRAAELQRSRADLEAWLGAAPNAFAYPFGIWGTDVDAATRDAAAAAGYRCAVVNGLDVPPGDPFLIPRASGYGAAVGAARSAAW